MNDFLNFGKYRHLTFLEVIKTDEDYVIWCSTFSDCSPAMQKLNRYYKSYLSQSQSLLPSPLVRRQPLRRHFQKLA